MQVSVLTTLLSFQTGGLTLAVNKKGKTIYQIVWRVFNRRSSSHFITIKTDPISAEI